MTAQFGAYLVNLVLTHTRPLVSDPHPIGSPGTGLGPCHRCLAPHFRGDFGHRNASALPGGEPVLVSDSRGF